MRSTVILFRRELGLAWAGGGGPSLAVGFYVAVATLAPISAAAGAWRAGGAAAALAWLVLVLASLLSLERLFERDFEDGALDLLALGPAPLEAVALVKSVAHFTAVSAPLALAAPVVAIALGATPRVAPMVLATAAIGGLAFAFVGALGAALALGSRRGGLIVALIVLPLIAPPVIFGGGAIEACRAGLAWRPALMLLLAWTLGAAALCPFLTAAAWRNASS